MGVTFTMKLADHRLLPWGLIPLLALVAPAGERLHSKIAGGTTLVRTFEQEAELSLTEMKFELDGESNDVGETPEYQLHDVEKLEVTDRVVDGGEERPLKLERTFDTIHGERVNKGGEGEDETVERTSKLESLKVLFTWNEDDGRYAMEFPGGEGDSALLEPLEEDLDLRGFLPKKEVGEDDTWKVDAKVFNRVFTPGGVHMLQADEEKNANEKLDRALEENADGDCTATFKGTREEDGVKVGVIAFEAKVRSEGEQDDEALPDMEGATSKTRVAVQYELKGELLWDLAGGHLKSFEASGTATVDFTKQFGSPDGEHSMTQTMVFSGKVGYTGTVAKKE
jgi:hypothetical protein